MKWVDNREKTKNKVPKRDKIHGDIVGMFIKYGGIHPDYYKPRIKSSIKKSFIR